MFGACKKRTRDDDESQMTKVPRNNTCSNSMQERAEQTAMEVEENVQYQNPRDVIVVCCTFKI